MLKQSQAPKLQNSLLFGGKYLATKLLHLRVTVVSFLMDKLSMLFLLVKMNDSETQEKERKTLPMKIVQEYSSTLTGELHSALVSFSLNLCDTIVLYNKLGFCIPHHFAENMPAVHHYYYYYYCALLQNLSVVMHSTILLYYN